MVGPCSKTIVVTSIVEIKFIQMEQFIGLVLEESNSNVKLASKFWEIESFHTHILTIIYFTNKVSTIFV